MRILIRFFVCVVMSLFCFGCSDDNAIESTETNPSVIPSEYLQLAAFGETLSVDEILSNVAAALNEGSSSRSSVSSLLIFDKWNIVVDARSRTVNASDSVPIYCVYDKERDISTIVCGNRLYPFTLAVIDGEFCFDDISLGGIDDYFSLLSIYLAENKLEYDANTIADIESRLVSSNYSDGVYSFVIQSDGDGALPLQRLEYEKECSYASSIGPLMTTIWAQGDPYNATLDLVLNEDSTSYVSPPVGCVAVAIGQILAYHKAPAKITAGGMTWQGNWDEMTKYPNAAFLTDEYRIEVADLMKVIGKGVKMNYRWNASGATLSAAYSFINSLLGFNTVPVTYYSFDAINYSLSNDCPVFICGTDTIEGSHAWVIDGSRIENAKVYERIYRSKVDVPSDPIVDSEWELISSVYQYDTSMSQVHCNWGWGDRSNGYFESGVFDVHSYSFNDGLYTICDINPY